MHVRTLVIGGSGFVGRYLVKRFNAVGTSASGKEGFIRLDITNELDVISTFERMRPEIVINAAALTDVDQCERNREVAFAVNAQGVKNLVRATAMVGARLVHISTDYVFDGEKGNYSEDDQTNPINEYGRSKLLGETYAKEIPSLIIRISSPFGINLGSGKESFFEYVVRVLSTGGTVRALVDQVTTPTFVEDVPRAIDILIKSGLTGTFHLAVSEAVSRYEFAIKTAELAGLDINHVVKAHYNEMKFYAKRPRNTSMNISKISHIYKPRPISGCGTLFCNNYKLLGKI